jgi:hypothetical protein
MRQASPVFDAQFPGLEMAAIYVPNHPDFVYTETSAVPLLQLLYPTGCTVEVPVFQRLSDREEAELGHSGVRKKPIGRVVIRGECRYACSQVLMVEMTVVRGDGTVVWTWALGDSEARGE